MKDRAVRAFSLILFQSRWGWPQVSLAGLTYFIATVQDGGKTGAKTGVKLAYKHAFAPVFTSEEPPTPLVRPLAGQEGQVPPGVCAVLNSCNLTV